MKKNTLARTMRLAQLAMLIAIQAILTFTPLGFIMIPPISIKIMHIPVIIGAVTMGPLFGGILGASFGVMSMLKATFAAASPADIIFSPFISGTPVQSLILCVVPRILLGVIAAWLFIGLKKLIKNETASIGLSAGIATLCHSAMVLGLMWFLFDSLPLKEVFATMMSLNCLLEIAMAVVVGMAVCKPLLVYLRKQKLIQK